MTPTEVRELEKKIDKLEKKLDFVIHHYIHVDIEEDWIDDPKLSPLLNEYISQAENDIKNGMFKKAEDVYKSLGL